MIANNHNNGFSFHLTITPNDKGEISLTIQYHKHGSEKLDPVYDSTVPASKAATMLSQILQEITRKTEECKRL